MVVLNETDAQVAEEGGASRLALATSMNEGGRTPDIGVIESVINTVGVPVRVMIRPSGGSFTYCDEEQVKIAQTVKEIAELGGVDGIVVGALTASGHVDRTFLEKVIPVTKGMKLTFNRAIDNTVDIHEAYDAICDYKEFVTDVLTSGGRPKAEDALLVLREMMAQSWERKGPVIMPCSGITGNNLAYIHRFLYAKYYQIGTAARVDRSFDQPLELEQVQQLSALCE
ncbi:cytoplasmic copper homeostasis protein CutC [Geomicrobium sp. JCM 19037]|uniref:copper homeostasis protein CutC n=1 Tax=Geomicrobium sp. JCM 19037 TaxID=1460634 RepID=UPI00045F4BDE|nr:copper homeostasis protein CutC [Geomicrobium sp. JCM 19037]GAK06199.1 cytoplasmic copper homeostasis protein CutC [Geomicrobium sp. JCM 19037]